MKESCHTYRCVPAHSRGVQLESEALAAHTIESRHTHERVMSHIYISLSQVARSAFVLDTVPFHKGARVVWARHECSPRARHDCSPTFLIQSDLSDVFFFSAKSRGVQLESETPVMSATNTSATTPWGKPVTVSLSRIDVCICLYIYMYICVYMYVYIYTYICI